VKPGEKLGIVGRTGAGKSSLTLAFFRFVEPITGSILIDGIDIFKIGTYDLRSSLTIIPQHPTLFIGTVRSNLDPFNQYSDQEMFIALRRSHLLDMTIKSRQSSLSDFLAAPSPKNEEYQMTHLTLDSPVEENGSNFSQGQKQLLCLARAILKRSKVIILDEATASVDHETDAKIQKTIREEFNGSTLLCIAHRLRTVIDYDKILVLKEGKVDEFGSPLELLKNPISGTFKSMCVESGEYEELMKLAKG
jgi:ABC-type multidrug transport system fused ATPase/permease subunit